MRTGRAVVIAVALTVVVGTVPMAVAALAPGSASAISLGDTVSGESGKAVTVSPGETVTVQVWANATAVRGYQTNLTYDPAIVTVDSVSGSDDFDDPVTNVNNEAGWVAFNQLRSGETNNPVLAEITLTVAEDASSSTRLSFVGADTKLSDGDGETASPESFNGIDLTVDTGSATATDTTTATDTGTPTATDTATPTETLTDDGTSDDGGATDNDGDDSSNNDDSDDGDDSNNDDGDDDDNDGGGGGYSGGGGGAISPPEPSFAIINTSLNRTSVTVGQSVMVSGTIENDGDEDGTFEARLYNNGTAIGSNATVEIPEGEERQVNLTARFNSSGVHAVKLNTTAVGNVTVRTANSTTNMTANGTGNETRNSTANETTNATETSTPDATATVTATDAQTATTTQTDTPTTGVTDDVDEATATSEIQTATTDGSGPGFSVAGMVVSLSLLLSWLGYRREKDA
jgi:hypothetical protein